MNIANSIEKIKKSYLPPVYQDKLCFDLTFISESELEDIIAIVLFGSCARNEFKVGSDLDILVITEEKVSRSVRSDISSELEDDRNGVGTDVIFYTEEEFNQSKSLLISEIKKDGIIIWED